MYFLHKLNYVTWVECGFSYSRISLDSFTLYCLATYTYIAWIKFLFLTLVKTLVFGHNCEAPFQRGRMSQYTKAVKLGRKV